MIFMLIMPMWAMSSQLFVGDESWIKTGNWLVVTIGLATIALEIWMIIEAWLLVARVKGVLEEDAMELTTGQAQPSELSSTC